MCILAVCTYLDAIIHAVLGRLGGAGKGGDGLDPTGLDMSQLGSPLDGNSKSQNVTHKDHHDQDDVRDGEEEDKLGLNQQVELRQECGLEVRRDQLSHDCSCSHQRSHDHSHQADCYCH